MKSSRSFDTSLIAIVAAFAFGATACTGDTTPTDTGTMDAVADTGPVSPCGANGPFGTYTISGGQSGVMACGHTFTEFTGATLTVARAGDGGSDAIITVTGSGATGGADTMNCMATVSECMITASGCTTSTGTVSFTLNAYTHSISGTAMPYVTDQGGCGFTYSVDGTR